MSCIFCEIVKGNIPAYKVWEDDDTLGFLDIHPINPGHVLVIPKKHEPEFQNIDDETYGKVMTVTKKVAEKIMTNLKPKRVGLKVEGWDVPHAHIHVVPLLDPGDITSKRTLGGSLLNPTPDDLKETQQKIIS